MSIWIGYETIKNIWAIRCNNNVSQCIGAWEIRLSRYVQSILKQFLFVTYLKARPYLTNCYTVDQAEAHLVYAQLITRPWPWAVQLLQFLMRDLLAQSLRISDYDLTVLYRISKFFVVNLLLLFVFLKPWFEYSGYKVIRHFNSFVVPTKYWSRMPHGNFYSQIIYVKDCQPDLNEYLFCLALYQRMEMIHSKKCFCIFDK